jgi:uncharacterized membrane protein YjjP (DUF1212 family)
MENTIIKTSENTVKPALPPYSPDAALCTALDVGEGLLRCGGEIQRVEDTITRICRAFGAVHVEAFTITSLIIASVRMPDGSYSNQTRRIFGSTNDLHKLSMYNAISREICNGQINIEVAQEKLKKVKKSLPYPKWVSYIGAVLAAGGFALFFGGNIVDAISAAAIGVIMTVLELHKPKFLNAMSQSLVSSFAAGLISMLLLWLGVGINVDKVMIGTIMLLIPGLTIGISVRDMLYGDTISGFMRMVQSLLLAVIIALGYGGAIILAGVILK